MGAHVLRMGRPRGPLVHCGLQAGDRLGDGGILSGRQFALLLFRYLKHTRPHQASNMYQVQWNSQLV